jgi:hypothetical protein
MAGFSVEWSKIRQNSLFVSTPCFAGQMFVPYHNSLMNLYATCIANKIPFGHDIISNESLVNRSRNYSADSFLRARWQQLIIHLTFEDGEVLATEEIDVWAPQNNVNVDALNQLLVNAITEVKMDSGRVIKKVEREVRSNPYTHMLCIDADIKFDPADVITMLALYANDPKYTLLTGAYVKKCIAYEKVLAAVKQGYADEDPNKLADVIGDFVLNPLPNEPIYLDRPSKVKEMGTGFMMIHRSVFDDIKAKNPILNYRPDHARTEHFNGDTLIMEYFPVEVDHGSTKQEWFNLFEAAANGEDVKEWADSILDRNSKASLRLISEDYRLCHLAREAGHDIWLCPHVKLTHTGTFEFGGSLEAMAKLQITPTADKEQLKAHLKPQVDKSKAAELRDKYKKRK